MNSMMDELLFSINSILFPDSLNMLGVCKCHNSKMTRHKCHKKMFGIIMVEFYMDFHCVY